MGNMIGIAAALVLVVGPVVLGLMGLTRTRGADISAKASSWNWRLVLQSMLLYTLAFNLIFFIQEFFLVLPKAFVPGLRPTLFHNNHHWEGSNELASLFQGTGALATFLFAALCMLIVRRGVVRSATLRLFLFWMAYCGFFMALPQVVIGALSSGSDLGMAMDYLQLGAATRTMAALIALGAIPLIARSFTRPFLEFAEDAANIASARARTRYIFQIATLPALLAIVLIIPFRVPREWIEVALLPLVVTLIGILWIQAGAWRASAARAGRFIGSGAMAGPFAAVLALLLIFQLVLRPGIHFY